MAKLFALFMCVLALNWGCVASKRAVDDNATNISKTADSVSKLADLINRYHSDDASAKAKDDAKQVAQEVFEATLKDKSLVSAETIKQSTSTIKGITEMAGIPYGGVAMDIISSLLLLFGGKKALDKRREQETARINEQSKWEQFLAQTDPSVAVGAKELFDN